MNLLFFSSQIPPKAVPVTNFDKQKYLGKWYEIARLPYRFENKLVNVTAEYSLNADQSIKVVNRGFYPEKNKWKQVTGKAKFFGKDNIAMLRISFFGPFYSGYNVIMIDDNYNNALVAGKNLNYLWILSRSKTADDYIKKQFLETAKKIGYVTEHLIWVKHDVEPG